MAENIELQEPLFAEYNHNDANQENENSDVPDRYEERENFGQLDVPEVYKHVINIAQAGISFNYAYSSHIQDQMEDINFLEDISPGQREQFSDGLETVWRDLGRTEEERLKAFRDDLHFLAKVPEQGRKFQELCKFLRGKGISLADDSMKGPEYKETVLHAAILATNKTALLILLQDDIFGQQEIALLLKQRYPSYAEGSTSQLAHEYEGTNAVHLAIAQGEYESLRSILEFAKRYSQDLLSSLLESETHGTFFMKRYPASFPLAMAIIGGNKMIIDLLLEMGARLDQQDSVNRNSVLHCFTLVNSIYHSASTGNFDGSIPQLLDSPEAFKWWHNFSSGQNHGIGQERGLLKRYMLNLKNKTNDNVLQFSSRHGCHSLVKTLLEVDAGYRFAQWRCGQTRKMLYDITDVIPGLPHMDRLETAKESVLETLVYNTNRPFSPSKARTLTEYLTWSKMPLIQNIMNLRWKAFRFPIFACFLIHLFVMICFSLTVVFGEKRCSSSQANVSQNLNGSILCTGGHFAPWFLSLLVLEYIIVALYLFMGVTTIANIIRRMWNRPWKEIFRAIIYKEGLFGLLFFSFTIFMILSLGFLLVDNITAFSACISLAGLSGWSYILIFSRVFEEFSIFTMMLQRIILGSLLHFAVVFIFVSMGFSIAIRALYWGEAIPKEFTSFNLLLHSMFQTMMTAEPPEMETGTKHQKTATNALFTAFIIIASIQMLNLLIAALSASYEEVRKSQRQIWYQNREKVVLFFERRTIWLDFCRKRLMNSLVSFEIPMASYEPETNNVSHKGEKRWFIGVEELHPEAL